MHLSAYMLVTGCFYKVPICLLLQPDQCRRVRASDTLCLIGYNLSIFYYISKCIQIINKIGADYVDLEAKKRRHLGRLKSGHLARGEKVDQLSVVAFAHLDLAAEDPVRPGGVSQHNRDDKQHANQQEQL